MNSDFAKHHRRSIRLPGYDYAHTGLYFVTICTRNRLCLFGDIENGVMKLTVAGKMVKKCWLDLPNRFIDIELDEYAVMPNHFHGIITIVSDPEFVGAQKKAPVNNRAPTRGAPTAGRMAATVGRTASMVGHTAATVGDVVGAFKSLVMNEYIVGVKSGELPPFEKSVWQRNYYEHIIRNEMELIRIQKYIINNPLQWELDRENPCPKNEIRESTIIYGFNDPEPWHV